MTFTRDGVRIKAEREDLEAIVATIGDPRAPVLLRGCMSCKSMCSQGNQDLNLSPSLCKCCGEYGHNFGGGRNVFVGKHATIMSVEQLAVRLRSAA